MNALVPQNNRNAVARMTDYDPYADAGDDMGGSNAKYLKFNANSGEFTFGAEAEELEEGTKLAVKMRTFRRGWICWKDEAVVEEIMVKVEEGRPPSLSELPDHGPYVVTETRKDGWSEQAAVDFLDPATGDEYTFKLSSKSGLRALGTLLKDYGKVYKSKPGQLPVIEIGSEGWMPKVKAHGKKYSPKLRIVDWLDESELASANGESASDYEQGEATEGETEQVETQTPAPVTQKAAAPAPAPAGGLGSRRRTF